MNRFLRFFDDISKVAEIKLKEITLALENTELLKDKVLFLEKENKHLSLQLDLFKELYLEEK